MKITQVLIRDRDLQVLSTKIQFELGNGAKMAGICRPIFDNIEQLWYWHQYVNYSHE